MLDLPLCELLILVGFSLFQLSLSFESHTFVMFFYTHDFILLFSDHGIIVRAEGVNINIIPIIH